MNKEFRFSLSEEQKCLYRDQLVPITAIEGIAEYSAKDMRAHAWTIKFKYIEWEDRSFFGCSPRYSWVDESIRVEGKLTFRAAIKKAFSTRFWVDCKPILYPDMSNSYFFLKDGCVCSKVGYATAPSYSSDFEDIDYILDRHTVVKEAIEYAKSQSLALPTDNDIKILMNLYDYLTHTRYQELSKESFERSFPSYSTKEQ